MPVHGVGIFLAGGTLGRSDFSKFKPGMIGKQLDQALADGAGGAKYACTKLPIKPRFQRTPNGTHASPRRLELWQLSVAGNEEFGGALGPMRVPRNCGLKVLRTQTTISVSAASGKTLACRTFAPAAARA